MNWYHPLVTDTLQHSSQTTKVFIACWVCIDVHCLGNVTDTLQHSNRTTKVCMKPQFLENSCIAICKVYDKMMQQILLLNCHT